MSSATRETSAAFDALVALAAMIRVIASGCSIGVVSESGSSSGRLSSCLRRKYATSRSPRRAMTTGRWLSRVTVARSSSNSLWLPT